MEKRIKTLYIITIVAILAFLGMQVYWLYCRYELTVLDQEDRISRLIQVTFDEYLSAPKVATKYYSLHSLRHQTDSNGRKNFSAEISWYDRKSIIEAYNRDQESFKKEKINDDAPLLDDVTAVRKVSYDAGNAPDEGVVWTAMDKVDIEFNHPLSSERIDSMLEAKAMKVKSRLSITDSMQWRTILTRHDSWYNPKAEVTVPYSELEKKVAVIEFHIPVGDVLKEMWESLAVAIILSIFLIVCLVMQFKTVLKLSRLDKMRNSFITTMIHELKRPISTLKMCVSGLDNRRMVDDPATRKELLSETRTALDNLSAYFSKLRDITFNNVEQIPLNIQSVNLHDLFDTVAEATVHPSGKRVAIHNDIAPDAVVSADSSHLYNILTNLVENAVKYSGSEVEVNASATAKEGYVEIMINDNGNGISSGDLKHVFKRFYRGQASSGDQPGMGLGLAYVKLLVEAHGGEIEVESSEGEGSRFTIKLPQ